MKWCDEGRWASVRAAGADAMIELWDGHKIEAYVSDAVPLYGAWQCVGMPHGCGGVLA